MNKQEIEKALSWVKEVINHQVFERATYEDTYGTGDLSEEERKEVYEEMDNNINLFKTIQCALTHQLNNGWIPVTPETNPKKSDIYLATFEENGKRYVERFYYSLINGWMMPVHWQDEGHIDKMLFWREMPEACEEVSE